MIQAGTWVGLCATILEAGGRADGIPADTANLPLKMWVKGYLLADCEIGEAAQIRTATGRVESGILEEVQPHTNVDYGGFVPEILQIGAATRKVLFGGGANG